MSLSFSPSQIKKLVHVVSSYTSIYEEARVLGRIPDGCSLSNRDAMQIAARFYSDDPSYDDDYVRGIFSAMEMYEKFQDAFDAYLDRRMSLSRVRKTHSDMMIAFDQVSW